MRMFSLFPETAGLASSLGLFFPKPPSYRNHAPKRGKSRPLITGDSVHQFHTVQDGDRVLLLSGPLRKEFSVPLRKAYESTENCFLFCDGAIVWRVVIVNYEEDEPAGTVRPYTMELRVVAKVYHPAGIEIGEV